MKKLIRQVHAVSFKLTFLAALLLATHAPLRPVIGQPNNAVVVFSAASFTPQLAPASIAAAFGTGLATRAEAAQSLPLPTTLAGTTVRLNGELAPLFFVSPNQINLLIPASLASGAANLVITASNGTVSRGTVQITQAAPALFTANSNGSGVPAAVALRVKADGSQSTQPVADFSQTPFLARPLDLGAANEQLFLILFGTGIRGRASLTDVAVRLGGVNAVVGYAGEATGFAGLDQINVLLPRELQGRGRVNLALTINGFGAANLVELDIAGAPNSAPPRITGYSAATVLAGQLLTLSGADFSPQAPENLVRIGGIEARVEAASATQLTIRVPFGAQSGVVSVRTPQGEGQGAQALQLRTSISGVVEDTRRQPLSGVTVRVLGRGIQAVTGAEGSFILPDVPATLAQELEFDGGTVPGSLAYPVIRLKKRVLANRDNQLDGPIALQQISGPGVPVGGAGAIPPLAAKAAIVSPAQLPAQTVRAGNVTFEFPAGATISLPNNATRGTLNLTLVENNRPPVSLPSGVFSATIPQLTPFSATLLPGGKLTLPNDERQPAGTQVKLFRLDQTPNSPTLGEFIEAGTATVSADGQRIETALNAITEITQYFVATQRQTTTVVGRVVDSNGSTPVRQALVRCRGQEAFTDGNGGFTLRGVVAGPGDTLSIEASFVRANGRVDRTQRSGIAAVANGLTAVTPDLILPAEDSNRAPVLLAPTALRVNEGETREVNFVAFDPDPGQTIQLAIAGANFATLLNRGNDVYSLRLQTRVNDAGRYTLALTATDNLGQSAALNLTLSVNRAPIANSQAVITDEDTPRAITLTGSDPDGDPLSFEIVSNPLHGRLSGAPPNLNYAPDARYTGSDSFTFKVNDGLADSAPATVAIAINPVNHRPTLTVPAAQTVNEGQELSFTVTASDIDVGQTLSFTATNLPGGASFTQTSGTTARFVWTPTFTQAGSYTVSFRVTDNGVPALSETKTVALTVRDVNRAPVLTVPGAQTVMSGQNINFIISATDPDIGQTVALSAEELPLGATFNPASGLFSWTPNASHAGAHTVTFKATDNGTPVMSATASVRVSVTIQWKPTAAIEGGSIFAMASNGANLFAGTHGGGIFRSTDNGQTWAAANTGLTNLFVNALVSNGTSLFVGTGVGGFVAPFGGTVFRSTNNGQSWTPVLENAFSYALAVSGTSVFVGINGNGIVRSTNNGQNWTPVNTGLPQFLTVRSFAVSGSNIFAGTQTDGVFLSTNDGQSWTAVNNGLPVNTTIRTLAVSGANVFAGTDGGLFVSSNNGQSWTIITAVPLRTLASIVVGTNIFVGSDNGTYRSTDNGQSWTPADTGIENTPLSFAVNGMNLFAGTFDGVFLTTNNGQNWTRASTGIAATGPIALSTSAAGLFAAVNGCADCGGGGTLYRSSDNGQSWTNINTTFQQLPAVYSFVDSGTNSFANLFAGAYGAVYLTTDNGQSWRRSTGLPQDAVSALAVSGINLFAGTDHSGVYRSADNGLTWIPANAGITNLFIRAIAVNGATLFAGTDANGIYRSSDNGQTWIAANAGLGNQTVYALTVDSGNVFAGTQGGIYRSNNNGNSWANVSTGLPANTAINAFALSRPSIFAATSSGVFVSTNQGQSWTAVSTGLPQTGAIAFAINGTRLFVGLAGSGVYTAQ